MSVAEEPNDGRRYPNLNQHFLTVLGVQILTVLSFLLSALTIRSCWIAEINFYGSMGVGYFSHQEVYSNSRTCIYWTDNDKDFFFDEKWKIGRAMAILAVVCGFLCMSTIFPAICVHFPPKTYKILAIAYFATALFELFSLISLEAQMIKDFGGEIRGGGLMVVLAALLWFVCGGASWTISKMVAADIAAVQAAQEGAQDFMGTDA